MLLRTLAADGVDTNELVARCGLDEGQLTDPDSRVPAHAAGRLWLEAVEATGDPGLGLHLAQSRPHGSLGVFDYAIVAASTLGEGWHRLARYFRLVHTNTAIDLEFGDDTATLRHRVLAPILPPRPIAEMVLGSVTVLGRRATQVDWRPLEVRFAHPRPANIQAHRSLFRCPVVFAAGEDALVVPRSVLDLDNVQADAELASLMRRYADDRLEELPASDDLRGEIRQLALQCLPAAELKAEKVARVLGMSARTLQRRLRDRGTTFQRVVDELRMEMAKAHLADSSLAISEIAYLLGFSEPSAFHRAFRRWTGQSVSAWRQRS